MNTDTVFIHKNYNRPFLFLYEANTKPSKSFIVDSANKGFTQLPYIDNKKEAHIKKI